MNDTANTALTVSNVMVKDRHLGWTFDTIVPFEDGSKRELKISTYKNLKSQIWTNAVVYKRGDNGFMTYAFSFGGGGDFSRTLELDRTGTRATEKAIRTQHQRHTEDAPLRALLIEAKAHYAPGVHPDVALPVLAAPKGWDVADTSI